jgi:heavy metal translocating P-type ATPase
MPGSQRLEAFPFDAARVTELAAGGIILHFILRYGMPVAPLIYLLPLYAVVLLGGIPLALDLVAKVRAKNFGADLLAGVSLVTSLLLGEYLVGAVIILMLAGGIALERFATRRASADLRALAKRAPQIAHRRSTSGIDDLELSQVKIGDQLIVLPHEICPADGVVIEGHGHMDESLLTGEPFDVSKAPGATVISGAINGEAAIVIKTIKLPSDSRYARIVRVMEESARKRPRIQRIANRLGAWYTPAALALAACGWMVSSDPGRFLAVLVIATPCPLLLAIPVAIVGGISLAARRGIIIRDPVVLERVDRCRTLIFDKTGTLTHGRPVLVETVCGPNITKDEALRFAASLEQYSKHPLASGLLRATSELGLKLIAVDEVNETPGQGLRGRIGGCKLIITGRNAIGPEVAKRLPATGGLECVLLLDGEFAALFRFRDEARKDSRNFIRHLTPRHGARKIMLVSGDRESEVRYLAEITGIPEVQFGKSPEEKVAIVEHEAQQGPTLFVGDGINDAPAMLAATVGVAFGRASDVTVEAASAVILESSLEKVDELIHIGRRMRVIALQSAVAGMLLSVVGMIAAVSGYLPPISGVVAQEIIDVVAVANALRVSLTNRPLSDLAT